MSTLRGTDGDAATAAAESANRAGDSDTETDTPETGIERDTLFHVLRNERRRRTLDYLLDVDDEPVTIGTLADAVAAAEFDTSVDALRYAERQRVYTALYQSHLPQMADVGLLKFDRDPGLIATTPHTQAVESYLDCDDTPERDFARWLRPVFGGAGLGIVFMLLVVEGVGPVHTVVLTVLLALLALGVRTWRRRVVSGHPLRSRASR